MEKYHWECVSKLYSFWGKFFRHSKNNIILRDYTPSLTQLHSISIETAPHRFFGSLR